MQAHGFSGLTEEKGDMDMKIRILIIDDEPRWINFVRNDLQKFEIVVAPDAETALAELEADLFDLVIASSRRLDVLQVIAAKYADKRVVVTTIQPTTQEALAAYRLGAMRYFAKSFAQEDLLNRVQEIISGPANAG
jgi:DNA-binding NtrC family response regulator